MPLNLWKSPYVLLLVATLCWGGNFVLGKAAVGDIPPFTLSFFRWITAVLILLPFTWKGLRSDLPLLLRHWRTVVLLSLTGVVGFNTLTYVALQYTTSVNASLVNAFSPIVIAVFSFLLLREKLGAIQWVGVLLSLLGLVMIVSHGSWTALRFFSFNPGDLIMIVAISSWGFYSVIVRKVAGVLPPRTTFTATILVGLLPMGALYSLDLIAQREVIWSTQVVGTIAYVAVFASIVAFLCWNQAVSMIGPSVASVFLNLIPIFAAIFALLFLAERLHGYHFVGALLTGSGVYTVAFTSRKKVAGSRN